MRIQPDSKNIKRKENDRSKGHIAGHDDGNKI